MEIREPCRSHAGRAAALAEGDFDGLRLERGGASVGSTIGMVVGDPATHRRVAVREYADDLAESLLARARSSRPCTSRNARRRRRWCAAATRYGAARWNRWSRSATSQRPSRPRSLPARGNPGSDLLERPVCAYEGRFRGVAPARSDSRTPCPGRTARIANPLNKQGDAVDATVARGPGLCCAGG